MTHVQAALPACSAPLFTLFIGEGGTNKPACAGQKQSGGLEGTKVGEFVHLTRLHVGVFTPAKSGSTREKAKGKQDLSGWGYNEGGNNPHHTRSQAQKNNKTVYSGSLMRKSQIYKGHLKGQGIQL